MKMHIELRQKILSHKKPSPCSDSPSRCAAIFCSPAITTPPDEQASTYVESCGQVSKDNYLLFINYTLFQRCRYTHADTHTQHNTTHTHTHTHTHTCMRHCGITSLFCTHQNMTQRFYWIRASSEPEKIISARRPKTLLTYYALLNHHVVHAKR
jgi:hypothetical protein